MDIGDTTNGQKDIITEEMQKLTQIKKEPLEDTQSNDGLLVQWWLFICIYAFYPN